jgi:AraC-like DNA-binding protein
MKTASAFEPHLSVNELTLPPGAEWLPTVRGWCFIQVRSGISYWQVSTGTREIAPGTVVVFTGTVRGGLRVSQLNEVAVSYFCMEPEKLSGLLSLNEQELLNKSAGRDSLSLRILEPTDPISDRFKTLCENPPAAHLSMRLRLLQLFIDLLQSELQPGPAGTGNDLDARARLRQFLKQTAASEFLNLSLSDLAPRMHCSPRHLSRLFRQEVGSSFRDKQTEMRLAKACQLLATSNAKVIDVALTSGYQSNSLFSLMFKKRFGVSPGKWRQRQDKKSPPRQKFLRMLPV